MIPAPDKSLFARQGLLLGWRMHCGAEVTELSTNKQHHISQNPQKAIIGAAQEKNVFSLVSLSLSRSLALALALALSLALSPSLSLSIFLYFTLLICSLLYYTGNASSESIATRAIWGVHDYVLRCRLHAHLRFVDSGM
jgi:hypothetical protein